MKKSRFIALILIFALLASVCACEPSGGNSLYEISLDPNKPLTVEVGDEIDYASYFIVTDMNGLRIVVTDDMLDLTRADTSKPGTFPVTLTVGSSSFAVSFTVKEKVGDGDGSGDGGEGGGSGGGEGGGSAAETFADVAAKYADNAAWNFAVSYTERYGGESIEEYYEYLGYNVLNTYEDGYGDEYTDYLSYDVSADAYCYYMEQDDGSYEAYSETSAEFEEYMMYTRILYLTELENFSFTENGGRYEADDPQNAGNAILGEYDGYEWTSVCAYVSGGVLSKLVGTMDDESSQEFVFSKYGKVSFTLPDGNGDGEPEIPTEPTGTMDRQNYDPAKFDREDLQDKLLESDGAIGLPSTGTFNALVIPVRFKGDTVTQEQLDNLEIAFNGTSEQTGWESVSSYYKKASYGALNLSFDIQPVYDAKYDSAYYAEYSRSVQSYGQTYTRTGEEAILMEALSSLQSPLDLTKYDTNGDGAIDAVYLIYSAPVDYEYAEFYWAYTTWFYGEDKYDGKDAYYYLFAGFDYMDESTERDVSSGQETLNGLKVNASTYIHETGHLLGLDDYYDTDERKGSNEGLGGADMMDYTVGDQNVYSKMMLGWLQPTIVNDTQTVQLTVSAEHGSAVLIPLDFNNSYFCEYLLIDLYSAQGLNALHASARSSYLYDGAEYGVRIYHVSSWVNDLYSDSYQSFTNYNNSVSKYALIKLVEADGEKRFLSSDGLAAASDLWQTGDKLSDVYAAYLRNDGKKVNFDVTVGAVSMNSATVTIDFS